MDINTCDYADDVFYAELRKQILLLTDMDEHPDSIRVARKSTNVSTAAGFHGLPGRCFSWGENEIDTGPAPAWLLKLWSNGCGTGVFIPLVVKSRRVPEGGASKSRAKAFKPVEKKKLLM